MSVFISHFEQQWHIILATNDDHLSWSSTWYGNVSRQESIIRITLRSLKTPVCRFQLKIEGMILLLIHAEDVSINNTTGQLKRALSVSPNHLSVTDQRGIISTITISSSITSKSSWNPVSFKRYLCGFRQTWWRHAQY